MKQWIEWSPQADGVLAEQFAAGVAQADIARALGTNRKTVMLRLRELGLSRPRLPRAHEWTEAETRLLVEMRAAGATAREISKALGGRFSRSAVLGKCHHDRIPFTPRADGAKPKRSPAPKKSGAALRAVNLARRREARRREPEIEVAPIPAGEIWHLFAGSEGVAFLDRKPLDQCAWPCWTDDTPAAERRCCGEPVPDGAARPYCRQHDRLAVSPRAPRKTIAELSGVAA